MQKDSYDMLHQFKAPSDSSYFQPKKRNIENAVRSSASELSRKISLASEPSSFGRGQRWVRHKYCQESCERRRTAPRRNQLRPKRQAELDLRSYPQIGLYALEIGIIHPKTFASFRVDFLTRVLCDSFPLVSQGCRFDDSITFSPSRCQ